MLKGLRIKINSIYLLSVLAVGIVGFSLWYSNQLVSRLADKEERLVEFWADVAEYIYNNQNEEAMFLLNNVLLQSPDNDPVVSVPAILTDSLGQHPLMHNFRFGGSLSAEDSLARIESELADMRSNPNFEPIRIELPSGDFQLVYYRETDELIQLRYYPYITIGVLLFFVGVVIANFVIVQRNRLNKVWVGLAKETAHQLGTPISGLMAWIELLKMRLETEEDQEILQELENDIAKLNIIAERFSKIGSPPDLATIEPIPVIDKAADYLRQRSSKKVTIEVIDKTPPGLTLPLSELLFSWVIENLLRNALDAGAYTIKLYCFQRGKTLYIDIEDDGHGMSAKVAKSVFKPGYTTKKRGWGLGLSLVQRIVRNFHRGSISLKFTEPGKGTTFRIQLPID